MKTILCFAFLTLMEFGYFEMGSGQYYEFYGVTAEGGKFNNGTIFKTDPNGNDFRILYDFPKYEEGTRPEGKLCAAQNGKYYGVTKFGGQNTYGVLFEWNPINNAYAVKYTFDLINGSYPNGSLIQVSNNKLYGMTSGGGSNDCGVLFEWDCSTNTFTKKLDFTTTTGSNPYGSLMKDDNGILYGRTWYGGLNNWGTLFGWDPATNTFLKHLDFNQGGAGNGSLVKATNGKFYGTTSGFLFEWDPATNGYIEKFDFELEPENGRNPIGSLVEANNGKLYGVTENGGIEDLGVLFEWDPEKNTYIKRFDFNGCERGGTPNSCLIQAHNGNIYGITSKGGLYNYGILFEWNPVTNNFTKKFDFNGENGNPAFGSLTEMRCNNYVKDIDGNSYKTVQIGNQNWMVENLKTTKFRNGTEIPLITNNVQWQNRTISAYCWINNNEADYKSPYGALYNWYTVNTNMLCPVGWHVPNNADWNALAELLGGRSVAGGKLKEAGVTHWSMPNQGATNESGFSALPASLLDPSMSTFYPIGNWVIWWSSTSYNDRRAYFNTVQYDRTDIAEEFQPKDWGFSVRCVQHLNSVPSLVTNFVTGITDNSSICGGSRCADDDSTIIACGVCWSTNPNPTINDHRTNDDIESFNFTSRITGLVPNTKYYVRAYAINNTGIGYGNEYSFKTMTGTIQDTEGNLYKIVTIGSQIWMAENLRVTKYNNNTPINKVTDNNCWGNYTIGSYGWYNNDESYKIPYGGLYNWYSVNTDMLCPSGWHVPTADDWNVLANNLGGSSLAAIKMLESGGNLWQGNSIGTNESGFTAIPGGYPVTGVMNMDVTAMYWSKEENGNSNAWTRSLSPTSPELFQTGFNKSAGLSIRCLMDATDSIFLQNGLLAYYPFNGNANDESGNGNNGVVRGAALTSDRFGSNNSAYYFDKNDAFIQLPNKVLNDLPNASISLWVYWNGERPSIILAKQHDWIDSYYILGIGMHNIGGGVDVGDTGRIYFRVKNSSSTLVSNSLLKCKKWNHLAITIDQSLKLYINGNLDAEISGSDFVLPDDLNATLTSLGIWLQDVRYSGVMNGNIDDIRFYDRALNGLEINALFNENKVIILTPNLDVKENSSFELPINAGSLISINNAISYQFDFSYDSKKLQFLNYDIAGTLSQNGSIQINPSENKLSIAWAGQTALADSGILLKIQFKALGTGTTIPVISKLLINTDTIRNITNGTVMINTCDGDVDGNGNIQAYDAALALQYSVGLDPLPGIDPLPWEDWRIAAANVDGQDAISAYDASLILQYTVELINSFSVQGMKKSTYAPPSDITVLVENGAIIFRSSGDLHGLNLSLAGNNDVLGAPQIINPNILVATNISSSSYSVGLATAYPPSENEIILKIPLIEAISQPISIGMKIDNRPKQIELALPTTIADPLSNSIEMYPNPANTIVYFKNLVGEASISIYDLQGRKITTGIITNNQVDIGNLDHGLYTISIENRGNIIIRKLIKN